MSSQFTIAALVALAACGTEVATDSDLSTEDSATDDSKADAIGDHACDAIIGAAKELCLQIPNNGWRSALRAEYSKPYFAKLATGLAAERANDAASSAASNSVYPATDDTFNALRLVPPRSVKVVIVGQDPYFNPGQAHGLSFSVKPGVNVPPSLNNLYTELLREASDPSLKNDLPNGFGCPSNGDLSPWARRGVLLLNSFLTVRDGVPGSHKELGWQSLTDAMLAVIRDGAARKPVAFLLWGSFARQKKDLLKTAPAGKLQILESNHPSPLSTGFVGNGHFAKANEFLVAAGRTAIDWRLPEFVIGSQQLGQSCAR
jgi:uracil-DNA glycosylase